MSNSKIISKITKLLNLANDQQGTGEGEAALSRAMELMAQYGIDERDVKKNTNDNANSMDVTVIKLGSSVKYKKQQRVLITCISQALGCYALGFSNSSGSITTIMVYGKEVDRERVKMLFSVASLTMVDSAFKAVPQGSYNIRARRLSHMIGYANAIKDSLTGHEATARDDSGKGALVIMDDYKKSKEFAQNSLGDSRRIVGSQSSRVDQRSYYDGYAEGSKFDTGSTSRISGTRAIGA